MWATRTISDLFRLAVIVGALPVTLTNGTTADATQVMADLNWLVNQVNANAAPLATTALTNVNNNFTVVQSGQAATQPANFPIASQVQNFSFNTLSSILGTNTIVGRVSALTLGAYAVGQVFTWIPAQGNTGAATLAIDGLAAGAIQAFGSALTGGELRAGVPVEAVVSAATPVFSIIGPAARPASYAPPLSITGNIVSLGLNSTFVASAANLLVTNALALTNTLAADVNLNNTGNYFDGPSVAQGAAGVWLAIGSVTMNDGAGAANFSARLTDGTTIKASGRVNANGAGVFRTMTLAGVFFSPAGNIRIQVKDETSTSGLINANTSGNGADSSIVVTRIG